MSNDQPAPTARRPKALGPWLLIAGFGGGFVLLVALLLGAQASPRSVEARLVAQPALAATVAAFRESYPADYAAWLAAIADIENRAGEEAADREAVPRLRNFITGKAAAIASAPIADLDALADANLATLLRLRAAGVPLCAAFVRNGAQGERLPPAALATVGESNAAQFRAARRGEGRDRVQRGTLSERDLAQWVDRIRAIDPNLAGRINDDVVGRGSPEEQCNVGVVVYRAASELPPEVTANVTALLVRAAARRATASR